MVPGWGGEPQRESRGWYAALETVVGLWSLALLVLIPRANHWSGLLVEVDPSALQHWSVAFLLPFFLLLPATFAMGATLPTMERLVSQLRGDARSVAGLYAANTFGAVAGTMLTTFVLAPAWGFAHTAVLLAAVNLVCAVATLLGPGRGASGVIPESPVEGEAPGRLRLAATLFLTGLLGIGYEILVVRVLSQVLENTVYSFASLLAVYLLGTAVGAALYQRLAPRHGFEVVSAVLLQGLALLCMLGVAILPFAGKLFAWLYHLAGTGPVGAFVGESGLAGAIFLAPTLLMGALLSHLAQGARRPGGGVGRALAVNTLGASMAPLVFGVVLLPILGSRNALLAVSVSYLLLVPGRSWKTWLPAVVPLGFAVVLFAIPQAFDAGVGSPGFRLVKRIEGVMASVSVVEDGRGDFYLKVNDKFVMGGTASRFSDWREAHIPLLLHPHPRTALFLGIGTGATFSASADYPELSSQGVELVPEVVEVLPYFKKATGGLEGRKGLQIHVADARRFITSCRQSFDVIVADLFHPARDGAGFLYTLEHFQAIRARLNHGGVFCQWLPLYQMDLPVLRTIVRTFMRAFPGAKAVIATHSLEMPVLGLIGGREPTRFHSDAFTARMEDPRLRARLALLRLDTLYCLYGTFIAGPDGLRAFAGKGPLNTDDRPMVLFAAPDFLYADRSLAHRRLFALLDRFHPVPNDIVETGEGAAGAAIRARLGAYWAARDRFLHAGIGVRPSHDLAGMLAQVRRPLLSIVRESPDFEAAYLPLLAMARQLYAERPKVARRLLLDLDAANPKRRDARKILDMLTEIQ